MHCQQGDLAVVVGSALEQNVGLFVDIIGPWTPGMDGVQFVSEPQPNAIWMCRARGKIAYVNIEGCTLLLSEGPIPDRCLRPIRPGQQARDSYRVKEIEHA